MTDEIQAGYRLSPLQKHLVQLHGREDSGPYNATAQIILDGRLEPDRLEHALQQLVSDNEILRTVYRVPPELMIPLQVIEPAATVQLDRRDWRRDPPAVQDRKLKSLQQELELPFRLDQSPLLRVVLVRLGEQEHRLLIALPALNADTITFHLLAAQLADAYDGNGSAELPELQYADLAEWLNETIESETGQVEGESWYRQLVAAPIAVRAPYERVPVDVRPFDPGFVSLTIPANLTSRFDQLIAAGQTAPDSFFLACWQAFLFRLTGQSEMVLGFGCHGRTYAELESGIGLFARFLPLPVETSGSETHASIHIRAAKLLQDAISRQEFFSWDLASALGQRQAPLPFFAFNFEYFAGLPTWKAGGVDFRMVRRSAVVDRFNLKLICFEAGDELRIELAFDRLLFEEVDVRQWVEQFNQFLSSLVENPGAPINALNLLNEASRRQVLVQYNQSDAPLPPYRTIHAWIAAQAERVPDHPALLFEGRSLTYRQLEARAARVADRLRATGIGRGRFVGLLAQNGFEMFIGMLGILRAGGAYLPLDPDYPAERLAHILEDAGVKVILVQNQVAGALPKTVSEDSRIRIVHLDEDGVVERPSPNSDSPPDNPDDYAYIIYTSGSTGKPKGVPITHRNLVHSTHARHRFYQQPAARFLLLSSFSFDSSVAGIFWTLTQGGTLVLPPSGMTRDARALSTLIQEEKVSHTLGLPSLYGLILDDDPARLASLQVVITAGEACPPQIVEKHAARLPHARLFNEYGPTEGTVWCSVFDCRTPFNGSVPIGKPIANTKIFLLNDQLQPVPPGVAGELMIAGEGIAGGYFNRPEETRLRFLPNPFQDSPAPAGEIGTSPRRYSRLYRTGDLARWLPSGDIEFLGRTDQQVKIRGYRVELGEIEAALTSHPAVDSAVVVAREDSPGDIRLVAYVRLENGSDRDQSELRSHLRSSLPEYMLPSAFVFIENMPMTANGKVDRSRLPAPDRLRPDLRAKYVAPRHALEKVLVGVWAQVLNLESVGVEDNFFELGGHSILVTQLVSRLRELLPANLPLRMIFDHPTIAGLAAALLESPPGKAEIERAADMILEIASLSEAEVESILEENASEQ